MLIYFHEIADIDPRTGYGGAFQSLYYALAKSFPGEVMAHDPRVLKPEVVPDVEIFFGMPYKGHIENFKHRYCTRKGIYTMYESERIPYEFIRYVEEFFDFIIVPTAWCKDIFERHFPHHPVHVCPLGVNPDLYPVLERPADRQPFTIMWQGFIVGDRKRADLVEQAFDQLNLPNARLIVKALTRPTLGENVTYNIINDRSSWILKHCNYAEMLSLWSMADFGIHPSNSEGVGMIPLEWMTTGMPVALARNSGAIDYCDPDYNYQLECSELTESVFKDGVMLPTVSLEAVKEVINHAYHNREEIREKGIAAAHWMRTHHTYDHSAVKFMNICRQLVQTEAECSMTLA